MEPKFDSRLRKAIDAAESVFADKGYGGASMRDVATRAGTSIAGLYYYLPSKQRALALVCDRAFAALTASLDEAVATAADPEDRLRSFVGGHLRFVVDHPYAYRVLLHDLEHLDGSARKAVLEARRRYFERAADLVIAVQHARPSTVSTRVATAALFGMMNWTPLWHRTDGGADASEIAGQMCDLFIGGITPSRQLSGVAG